MNYDINTVAIIAARIYNMNGQLDRESTPDLHPQADRAVAVALQILDASHTALTLRIARDVAKEEVHA